MRRRAPRIHPISFSFRERSTARPDFRRLSVIRLSSPTLLSCLRREKVGATLTGERYHRTRFAGGNGQCFTVTFPGVSNKCRVHGQCFGNYVTPGRVSRVERSKRPEGTYCIFRKFVSCLSFLALELRDYPRSPSFSERSCVILGSITGISGTLCPLNDCRHVRYFLSGSHTKVRTLRRVEGRCSGTECVHSTSRVCNKYGSLGRCLRGQTRAGGRTRSVGIGAPPGGPKNFQL